MLQSDELHHFPAPAVGSLELLLILNILRTHNYLNPHIDRSLRELKLRVAQFNALLVLYAERDKGLPLGEIGRRLVVTKANVTGLVDRLEDKGLVVRDSGDDRRVTVARLTSGGVRLLEEVLPGHRTLVGELVDCLTDSEKRRLVKLLTKLRAGLRKKYHHHQNRQPAASGSGRGT